MDVYDGTSSELVKEQVMRVFLERMLVQRPHPFGIIDGFIRFLAKSNNSGTMDLKVVEDCRELKALMGICRKHVVV